jgi:hypothetical protein
MTEETRTYRVDVGKTQILIDAEGFMPKHLGRSRFEIWHDGFFLQSIEVHGEHRVRVLSEDGNWKEAK